MINFKLLFPLVVGLSFWICGNILLVKKLQIKTTRKNESNRSIGLSMDQNLKKNKFKERRNINSEANIETFHLNSLITKNISLFTKNPNYKMLAWLITQLIIFSLFIFAVNIFKNNLVPYINA